jgi:HAD superfamily hydrolase (TIGR01509 family)
VSDVFSRSEAAGIERDGIRAVLFDAGNTIIYPRYELIAEALLRFGHLVSVDELHRLDCVVRDEYNLAGPAKLHEVRKWTTCWRKALKQVNIADEVIDQVFAHVAAYDERAEFWTKVYPDAVAVLAALRAKGFILGVVSNSNGRIERYLEKGGLREYLDFVVDSSVVGVEKPEPRIFQIALEMAGAKPEETVFVGDCYPIDVLGARRVGLRSVLLREVTRLDSTADGNRDGAFDCPVIESLAELLPLLTTMSAVDEARTQ